MYRVHFQSVVHTGALSSTGQGQAVIDDQLKLEKHMIGES